MLLAAREGVNVNGVDDARKRNDVRGRVFSVVLVKGEALWTEDEPDLLPLAHAAL